MQTSNCIQNSKCMSLSISFVLKKINSFVHFLTYFCIFIKLYVINLFIFLSFVKKSILCCHKYKHFCSRKTYLSFFVYLITFFYFLNNDLMCKAVLTVAGDGGLTSWKTRCRKLTTNDGIYG